ncbi:HNH endonuclease [Sediminibacterium sp.]|uniref:HNH endonuclease n=1 Tax=Sediminibacterium sp. TaxID=1917865 RepID=UPI003F71A02D
MADPICRWRNPFLTTVTELIDLLPKQELSQQDARELVNSMSTYSADFYTTPYQLACQLGLYHETSGRYFPKFTFAPSEGQVLSYLQNWIIHYCIPNPYTRGFDNIEPFSIHAKICEILFINNSPTSWQTICQEIFGIEIGNQDILKNSIKLYSPILLIEDDIVMISSEKSYEDLLEYINVDILSDRNNKEYFFDLFQIDIFNSNNSETNNLLQDISSEEVSLITEIQRLPNVSQTEKNQIIAARIGQGYFRRTLILECRCCPITQVNDTSLLIASHIKPWRISENSERINPKNGFLFTPTYDKLFDKGLISFTNDKRILVSSTLTLENQQYLNLQENTSYPLLPIEGRELFLEFHRDVIFKNQE